MGFGHAGVVPSDVADFHAPLGLRITAGPVSLVGITDELVPRLCDLVLAGIHPPDRMPFLHPWTDAPRELLGPNTAQYYWRARAEFTPASWNLDLAVVVGGDVVGVQGLVAQDYAVTRSVETGSWLGRAHQGRGIGTAMRRAVCVLAFDHLGAVEVTSGAFVDNPASLAVSRKVGYRANGTRRRRRREGEVAVEQMFVLTPDDLVRPEHPVEVEGAAALRRAIGLE